MSRTAAAVGVFGTVQSKLRAPFPLLEPNRQGVMSVGKLWPPSSDSQISASHHDRSTGSLGNNASHTILTFCPGKTTSPACGETSLAAYVPSGAAVEVLSNCGAKANATANNVTTNPRVFILSPPFECKNAIRSQRLYVKHFSKFLSPSCSSLQLC